DEAAAHALMAADLGELAVRRLGVERACAEDELHVTWLDVEHGLPLRVSGTALSGIPAVNRAPPASRVSRRQAGWRLSAGRVILFRCNDYAEQSERGAASTILHRSALCRERGTGR